MSNTTPISVQQAAKEYADKEASGCGNDRELREDPYVFSKQSLAAAFLAGHQHPSLCLESFQKRVHEWLLVCFGESIAADVAERNYRFIEEALELVQSTGATKSECHQLVDYVFNREIGERRQEVGGVNLNTI